MIQTNYGQNITFSGRKIPLKDYTGTILHLTKKDKAEIAQLQQEIAEL